MTTELSTKHVLQSSGETAAPRSWLASLPTSASVVHGAGLDLSELGVVGSSPNYVSRCHWYLKKAGVGFWRARLLKWVLIFLSGCSATGRRIDMKTIIPGICTVSQTPSEILSDQPKCTFFPGKRVARAEEVRALY